MNRVEVVVKVGPLAAMPRIAGQADSRATVPPMARPPDVGATRAREEYVSTAVATLCVALQASGSRGECGQVSLIVDDDEYIDVLGIRFSGRDRSEQSDRSNAGDVLNGDDEPPQSLQQVLTVIVAPVRCHDAHSSAGTSFVGTKTSMERACPAIRRIKPCRSSVTIMLWTEGGVTPK